MPTLVFPCELRAPLERVWAFHESVDTLFLLTPPGVTISLDAPPEPARLGVRYPLRIKQFGIFTIRWLAEYVVFEPPHRFVDEQVSGKGPFKAWRHEHRMEATPDGTLLTDTVTYTPPFGVLGSLADPLVIRPMLRKMFAFRHKITRQKLETP